jgi:hypothetical protein
VKKSLFDLADDTRMCSNCTCNGVDGGTCIYLGTPASSVTVYSSTDCSGNAYWYNVTLDTCSVYNGTNSTLTSSPASLTYTPTIRHGTCSGVASNTQFSGSVTVTGTTTVCCM